MFAVSMFRTGALQELQGEILAAVYSADPEDRAPLVAEYDQTVVELRRRLGANAHCAKVDCDLFGFYSDWYKDENGFRPRHHVTYDEVKAALSK